MTEADAKNSALVIEGRKPISDAYMKLVQEKDPLFEEREYFLPKQKGLYAQ